MLNYSKKQLKPLIDKYQINTETNALFARIIEMFDGQPNYQLWGVKSVFSQVCLIGDLTQIKEWSDEHQEWIKHLSKGNITAYKTKTDFKLLKSEMDGCLVLKGLRDFIANFNTEQRELLTHHILDRGVTPAMVKGDSIIKKYSELFKKIERLPSERKKTLFKTASNVHVNGDPKAAVSVITSRIESTLKQTYAWDKEDCIAFVKNNHPKCEVVFDEGPYLVIQIDSYNSSASICGGSRTLWCITNQSSQWENYVQPRSGKRKQYFFFDFSKPEDDPIAHVGFTIDNRGGILYAQSRQNSSMKGEGIVYGDGRMTIEKLFKICGIKMNIFMKLNKNDKYEWNSQSIMLKIGELGPHAKIIVAKDDIIICGVDSRKAASELIGHTFIDIDPLFEDSQLFLVFNTNLGPNDEDSIVAITAAKDRFGSLGFRTSKNAYGNAFVGNVYDFLRNHNIPTSELLGDVNIKPELLLHKYIEERNERDAIALVRGNNDLDVNFEFEYTFPVQSAIAMKMFDLFQAIVSHKNYNKNCNDQIAGSVLIVMLIIYASDFSDMNPTERETLKSLITSTIKNKSVDFNARDLSGDTALSIACDFPSLSWAVKLLVDIDEVDVNSENDSGITPITNAMTSENREAIEILLNSGRVELTAMDKNVASQLGFTLSKVKKESFAEAFRSVFGK